MKSILGLDATEHRTEQASVLGLDLPTFSEIRAEKALKSVPFPEQGSAAPYLIFPNMNAWQDAISRALSPGTQPSSDPHLSALVAAGYTWLGSTLPEPDLQVKKEFLRKRGGKKKDDNVIERHPIYDLFKRPNPYTSGSTLWKAFAYSHIIDGNVYFLKIRNRNGQVVQLWYEPHFNVRARWVNDRNGEYIDASRSKSVQAIERNDNSDQFINYYELKRDSQRFRVEPADVIHFRDGIDPYHRRYGLSRMTSILREIFGDSAVASYAANLLAGNGVIPYVVGIDDKEGLLSQDDLNNIKAKLIEQTTGQNAGQGLVLSARATFNRTGLTPAELDLRKAREMAQDMFSAVTGIPAIVLNFSSGMERSIYNNMSEADRRAVASYLVPLWWHIAQELSVQLLPDFDQDASHFIEFDTSEVAALQEDENAKVERVIKLYEGGVIKRAEARTELDYEADPDGADDVYLVKAGTETVSIEEEEMQRDAAMETMQNPPDPDPLQLPAVQPRQLAVAGKALELASGSRQIVIIGGPHTGKTTLAARLRDELKIAKVMHSTDDLRGYSWSEQSAAASQWFNEPGDWIVEGVSTARALRKWLAANPGQPLRAEVLVLNEAFTPLLRGQKTMTAGVHTVLRQIEPELERRGARVVKIQNANDALQLFSLPEQSEARQPSQLMSSQQPQQLRVAK